MLISFHEHRVSCLERGKFTEWFGQNPVDAANSVSFPRDRLEFPKRRRIDGQTQEQKANETADFEVFAYPRSEGRHGGLAP